MALILIVNRLTQIEKWNEADDWCNFSNFIRRLVIILQNRFLEYNSNNLLPF
jgi:hypothetical protein